MATASPKFDFVPAEDEVPKFDFTPDTPAFDFEPAQDVDVEQEAQRATIGAMQAVDLATLPGRLDWSGAAVQEADRLNAEADALAQQLGAFDRARADFDPAYREQQLAARNQVQSLRTQAFDLVQRVQREAPQSEGAQILRSRVDPTSNNPEGFAAANPVGRFMRELVAPVLPAAADTLERAGRSPLGLNLQANIGPAAGGAIGAATFATPAGPLRFLGPLAGGLMGAQVGGAAQETVERATETPDTTAARQEALATARTESPVASMVGGSLANLPFFRPSLKEISLAMSGNRAAQTNVAAAAGIGAGIQAAMASASGQPTTLGMLARGAIENILFNRPTALGRALGFRSSTPEQIAKTAIDGVQPTSNAIPESQQVTPTPESAPLEAPQPARTPDVAETPSQSGEASQGTEGAAPDLRPVNEPFPESTPPATTPEAPAELPAPIEAQQTPEGVASGDAGTPAEPVQPKPAEPPIDPERVTSIKNAQVDAERQQRGLPPAMEPVRRTFGTVWDSAMREVSTTPGVQDALLADLRQRPRALTDREDALLLHRQIEVQNEFDRAVVDVNTAAQSGDDAARADAEARLQNASERLQDIYDIGKKVGTETGRGLAARKMLAKADYTLAPMVARRQAAKGGEPLTPQELETVQKQAEEIQRTDAALEARTAELETEASGKSVDEVIAAESKNTEPAVASLVQRITTYLDNRATSARERLRRKFEKGMRLGAVPQAPDPTILLDVVDLAASEIARGTLKLGQWSAKMVGEFGDAIRPYLQPAWDRANAALDSTVDSMAGPKNREKVKRAVRKQDAVGLQSAIAQAVQDGAKLPELRRQVQELAKSYVRSGVTNRDELIDAVKASLDEVVPNLSRRDVMDAISGYGDMKPLTKDQVSVTLRDLKGQMQQVAKLEDIQAKQPLRKTGVERRTPSDEERRLIREVNDAKKKHGVVTTDPATQLKGALDATKTRLRNQIKDLTFEIETGTKPSVREPLALDEEAQMLRGLRDRVRQTLRDIEGAPQMTDEQRVKLAQRSLEDQIAIYEQRIRNRETAAARQVRKAPDAPQLQALRARRDALRAELDEMRAHDAVLQENRNAEALVRQIQAAEQTLATGVKQRAKPEGPETQLVAEAREQLRQLREQISAKRAPEQIAARQQRTEAALEKSIADLDRRIQEEDFSARKLNVTPDTPRIEELRAQRDAMRQLFNELKSATKPKLTPEQIALKSLKTRLAHQNADLTDRLARGDFARKERKPVDISRDPEAMRLKAENERIKREFESARIADERARRSFWQKTIAASKETLNLPRTLLSSWDVSAVLRHGGFITLGNPVRGLRAAKDMFKALASERRAQQIEQSILSRPNAPLYERSGLYIAPLNDAPLAKMEETIMSELANKIPGIRASNRAFVTFLNKLRADSFDAMKGSLEKRGVAMTQPELEAIANYINVATGRANLGSHAKAAETLATVFFSPRLLASRFQMLAGQPLYRGTARTRTLVAKEYAKLLTGLAMVYGLAKLGGADVETDPRSSDFGKIRFGNTRVDPLAGLAQATTLLSRVVTGETKTPRGEVKPLREELRLLNLFRDHERRDKPSALTGDTSDVIARFLRTKLSPTLGTAIDVVSGKNVVGEKVGPKEAATQLVVPLSFRDILDVMEDQGVPRGTALTILSLFGWGLQSYER